MKEHPILFSTPMVQAIQEDRKTQTRRAVKEAKGWDYNWRISKVKQEHKDGVNRYEMRCNTQYSTKTFKCHYGKVGDLLWVRETYAPQPIDGYFYKADGIVDLTWKPSIFMPKVAARIWLEITNIKVERLHDISEGDAMEEGIFFKDYGKTCYHNGMNGNIFNCPSDEKYHPQKRGWSYKQTTSTDECLATAKTAFANLWQSFNGIESWDANPWVWVIEFKRINK